MRPSATAFATCVASLCAASMGWGQAEINQTNALGLGWTACSTTNPIGVNNFNFLCETEQVNACRVIRLMPTFVSTINDAGFAGSTVLIDVLIGSAPTVGQWWSGFVPGGCRVTPTLSTVGNITAASLPAVGACRNLYPPGAATLPGQQISNSVGRGAAPNRYRVSSANSVYPIQTLTIGERAYAMQLEFKTEGTLADCDPAVDPTPVCTDGCCAPVCFILNDVSIFMEVGTGNPNPDIIHYSADGSARNFATYQGGMASCVGYSPVVARTWGAVKALYR